MTISNQIIEVIDALCVKFGIAIDWTQENVLPYLQTLAQEYISYEIWTSVMWIVLVAIGLVVLIVCTKKAKKAYNNADIFDEDCYMLLYISCCVASIFCSIALVCVIFTQTLDIITCITFPEKIILEFIQSSMTAS